MTDLGPARRLLDATATRPCAATFIGHELWEHAPRRNRLLSRPVNDAAAVPMNIIESFAPCPAAFEGTYVDDDLSRLRRYFTDDGAGTRFDGLRTAVNTFDRCSATRIDELRGDFKKRDGGIAFDWDAEHTAPGAPTLRIGRTERALYEGDRIRDLKDIFDAGATETIAGWMAQRGEKLSSPGG
ncbi:MAG: hypothetical protein E4H03_05805 [Myxococcales bacterium]|nr:MAG: hypothetical protein E4H03_05805 [Myxococcales bacterium]